MKKAEIAVDKSVSILMATYEGENFIEEQLESILRQSHTNWKLIVSDDGSTDSTPEIIKKYEADWPNEKISLRPGPRDGFCKNFLSMACDPNLSSDYYAFSDQDDIWEPEKLSTAINWLDSIPRNIPALYCGRTATVDNEGNQIGLSPHFKLPPSFCNALVQSIAGGNTMVFNEAARKLLVIAGGEVDVPSHDWWLYILVTGAGGVVKYDPLPMIYYRQHLGNLVGANKSWTARWSRLVQLLRGRMRSWNAMHVQALTKVRDLFTTENQKLFDDFERIHCSNLFGRIRILRKSGFHRQTKTDQLGLLAATVLRKM